MEEKVKLTLHINNCKIFKILGKSVESVQKEFNQTVTRDFQGRK
jgi:hypothetical protein